MIPCLTPAHVGTEARKKKVSESVAVQADTVTKFIGPREPVAQHQREAHFSGGEADRTQREQCMQTYEEKEAI